MIKKGVFIWCCDLEKNTGEGILANKFIDDLKQYNKNCKFYIKKPSIKNKNIILKRFLFPFLGIMYLWKVYLEKKNKKVCYVNYLPIWNFLLFFLLPPKTILGPITGGSLFSKKPFINYFLRRFILNFFCILSFIIIKIRHRQLLFSTDLIQNSFFDNKKYYFNYVLKDLSVKKLKIKKKYDLIFYLRDHKNKNLNLQIQLAKTLSSKFKIITVGKKILKSNIKNFGYIPRSKLFKILKITKFAFLSPENPYSLFAIDSISSNTNVFFNKGNKLKSKAINGISYVNYNNFDELNKEVTKKLLKKFSFNIKLTNIKKKFSVYFKI